SDRSFWNWYGESCSCGLPPGECSQHPRARSTQRPPAGDWRVWAYVARRGAGKTRVGGCWVQKGVESDAIKRGCLIAPTTTDTRDVMGEDPSGLIAVAPPWWATIPPIDLVVLLLLLLLLLLILFEILIFI